MDSSLPGAQHSAPCRSWWSTTHGTRTGCAWTYARRASTWRSPLQPTWPTTRGTSGRSRGPASSSCGNWAMASSERCGRAFGTTPHQLQLRPWRQVGETKSYLTFGTMIINVQPKQGGFGKAVVRWCWWGKCCLASPSWHRLQISVKKREGLTKHASI